MARTKLITVRLTPEELTDAINDSYQRLSYYQSESPDCDFCDFYHDPIMRWARNIKRKCVCTDDVKRMRKTIEKLESAFRKQAPEEARAWL